MKKHIHLDWSIQLTDQCAQGSPASSKLNSPFAAEVVAIYYLTLFRGETGKCVGAKYFQNNIRNDDDM